MFLNGHDSNFTQVKSGVPQGTVLGPLMSLLYVNGIDYDISSQLQLFADDCILHRVINNEQDKLLQHDLNLIVRWTESWQMNLNISKSACSAYLQQINIYLYLRLLNEGDHYSHRVNQHHYLDILFDPKKYHLFVALSLKQQGH